MLWGLDEYRRECEVVVAVVVDVAVADVHDAVAAAFAVAIVVM